MNDRMVQSIFGCSAFGLDDMVVDSEGTINHGIDFSPASVILPSRPFGPIMTGDRAKFARVHSGLPWPPEAWVKAGEHLRRVPICCAWRALVEARDRQVRWKVGGGVSFPIARILAAHIANLFSLQGSDLDSSVVLTIPNDLDEYGQENLLTELHKEITGRGRRAEIRLLWRPVAAALSWLKDAGEDIKIKNKQCNPDDFFLVLCLSPDAIECATFRMRTLKNQKGNYVVVPRRERPLNISSITGYDWVGSVLEQLPQIKNNSIGAFWQAFISFPEVWSLLAGKKLCNDELPRVWGGEKGYDFWSPDSNVLLELIEKSNCGPSHQAREILTSSCNLSGSTSSEYTWPNRLTSLVLEHVKNHVTGRMVGMVVCGPLAPPEPPGWLSACFPDLEARGLDTKGPWDTREGERLWISPGSTAIAQGAVIFQKKLQKKEPTYLDALPKHFLLIKQRNSGRYTTFPLVDQEDAEGGEDYKNEIKGQFSIEKNFNKLDIIISRHGRHEELLKAGSAIDRLDNEVGRDAEGLSEAECSLVRHLVRTAKNINGAMQRVRWNLQNFGRPEAAIRYADFYVELWHETGKKQLSLLPKEPESNRTSDSPFRLLTFPFPVPSPRRMPVDLLVRIRPASGLAQLEIKPEDTSFLHGRPVKVDYRSMRPCQPEELASESRGWPPLEERTPHPDLTLWRGIDNLLVSFEEAHPPSDNFKQLLDRMYDFLKTSKLYRFPIGGYRISLPVLSQVGRTSCQSSNELIARFSAALQNHTVRLSEWQRGQRAGQMGWLITRATWLYGATPENIINQIQKDIRQRMATTRTIEAGSRALTTTRDIFFIFDFIAWKIQTEQKFVIQNIRACTNILCLRKNGQDALKEKTAQILLEGALKELREFAEQKHYKIKFFASLKLLLYLLRYRQRNESFLSFESGISNAIKEQLADYLPEMMRLMPRTRYNKAQEIIRGINQYLDYEGSTEFLNTLTKFSESDADNDY